MEQLMHSKASPFYAMVADHMFISSESGTELVLTG